MNFFKSVTTKLMICLCGIVAYAGTANAYYEGQSELGLDGTGSTVATWRVKPTTIFKVQAAYGTGAPWTPVDVTDTTVEDALDYPILAVSKDNAASTRAAVIWVARLIADVTPIKTIRVSVFDGTNWSAPVTLSAHITDELVRNDYLVSISDDGETITVTWTAFITSQSANFLRSAVSTDGGTTWSVPSNIANLGGVF